MELEILGSGTSHGIPVIACDCPVCKSTDPRDNRMRASALLRFDDGTTILIDPGPEFRLQALRTDLHRLDAVLITHSHADHIHGLDDVRIFSKHVNMPVYADTTCVEEIKERFAYIFRQTQEGGGKPRLELMPIAPGASADPAVIVAGQRIVPVPLQHGIVTILGWRIGDTAYLTDCSAIGEESLRLLAGVKNLVIDALRLRHHSTHFNFTGALAMIGRIGPERAWFTHLCHDFSHEAIRQWLAANAPGKKIEPAFDGLRITIGQ